VIGALALLWVGFLLRHAVGAHRAAVRVHDGGVTIRNIASRFDLSIDEVEGFYVDSDRFSYSDEIFFTDALLNFVTAFRIGMPESANVKGVHLRGVDGREISIWSLMDNTDDPLFGWPKQKTAYDWQAVARDLNGQLEKVRKYSQSIAP